MSKHSIRSSMTAAILAATLAAVGVAHAQYVLCPNGPCTGVDPTRLPRLQQYVSPPDMVMQFSECLGSPFPAFVSNAVRDGLTNAMNDLDLNHDDPAPTPDVRQSCVNGKLTVGGWLFQPGSYGGTDTATARNVGLSQVNVLAPGEEFAFHFRSAAISRLVNIRWQDQPRRLDDDGNADPGGAVHLDGFHLAYTNKDAFDRTVVDLGLDGWYDGPFSNTDITIHIYDFLTTTSFGQLQCETLARADATETTIDTVLASLSGGAGGSLGDVVDAGPGCKIARMVPRSVLVAGYNLKAVFTYTRVNAYASTGLTLAGTWELLPRQAWASFSGSTSIVVEPGDPIAGTYTAQTADMRPPLTFRWTSLHATPVTGTGHPTMVWNIPGGLAVGQTTQRNLALTVTDADGFQAQAVRSIQMSRVAVKPIPAPCKTKPWLPQCKDL